MHVTRRTSKAFSLIELSIIILIVGILVAGVFQSKNLVNKYRLHLARSLTNSSPVSAITDLLLWYETSLEQSFIPSEAVEGGLISTWKDINPQNVKKNDAYCEAPNLRRPTFISNAANGLPVVRFKGSDHLFYPGQGLVNSDYVLFLVEQRSSDVSGQGGTRNPLMGSLGNIHAGENIEITYLKHTGLGAQYIEYSNVPLKGAFYFPYANYSSQKLVIHSFIFSRTKGTQYYSSDGARTAYRKSSSKTYGITTYDYQTTIGSKSNKQDFLLGDIAEIIIFNRSLKVKERKSIEKYLGQKYRIKIYENLTCPNSCGS